MAWRGSTVVLGTAALVLTGFGCEADETGAAGGAGATTTSSHGAGGAGGHTTTTAGGGGAVGGGGAGAGGSTGASCSDPAAHWLFCEDWDMEEPPGDFPSCQGAPWHGITPKNYDCQWGEQSAISSDVARSAPRSFHQVRAAGDAGTMDLSIDFAPQQKVHLRMYVRFAGGFVDGEEEIIHFVFFNTAVAGVNFGVDLFLYTDFQPAEWPPLCTGPDGLFFGFHSYHNTSDGTASEDGYGPTEVADCWNIGEHEDQWYSLEVMWDLAGARVQMWLDGQLRTDREMYASNHDHIDRIILSGWNSCGSCTADAQDFYLDDIVIATDYVGP